MFSDAHKTRKYTISKEDVPTWCN